MSSTSSDSKVTHSFSLRHITLPPSPFRWQSPKDSDVHQVSEHIAFASPWSMSLNGVQAGGIKVLSCDRLIERISLNGVETVFRVSAILQVIEKIGAGDGARTGDVQLGKIDFDEL